MTPTLTAEESRRRCAESESLLAEGPPRSDVSVLNQHAERAKYYHGQCRERAVDSAVYAYLAGKELLALKEVLPHGKFMHACEAIGIPHSSVNRYMPLAQALDEQGKLPMMGNLKLLANGKVEGDDKERIAKAFHDAVDGKTLTEFYRGIGVIRPPKPKEYHPPKPVDAKAKVAEDFEVARKQCLMIADLLRTAEKEYVPLVDDAVRTELYDACVRVTNLIRAGQRAATARRKAKVKG